MGLPSQIFTLWARLIRRFLLEPSLLGGSVHPNVDTTIWPVTDADELLRTAVISSEDTASLGVGRAIVATVPAGERWQLYQVNFERNGGDRNIDRWEISDGTNFIIVETFTAAGLFQSGVLATPQPMDEGWEVIMQVVGGTSSDTWRIKLFLKREQAFETPS